MSDVRTTRVVVIFRVKVSCITAVGGIKLWLLTCLVYYVAMFLVICHLSPDVIGSEDSKCAWCVSIPVLSGITVVYC